MARMGRQIVIATLTTFALVAHFALRVSTPLAVYMDWPLWLVLGLGGSVLIWDLLRKALRGEFGSDLLAGIAIVTSVVLGEYLAGSVVVLMLSGGEALESYAVGRASSALQALADRMPTRAHRKREHGLEELPVEEIAIGDLVVILPHELAPVDGEVVEGQGRMDESFLTGEPYERAKAPGSAVLSGAINGDSMLVVRADKLAVDSRYAKITQVMKDSQQRKPRIRRLGDQLGAIYTPIGVGIAALAWFLSGEPERFLSVLVIATPCPLLIAIPVAIIGAVSLSARRGIVIRDPSVLEQVGFCQTMILDKTGTLTYGLPQLTDIDLLPGFTHDQVLRWAASLERYSRHPLATAVSKAADEAKLDLLPASEVRELPGKGMCGVVQGVEVSLIGRKQLGDLGDQQVPAHGSGLEAMLVAREPGQEEARLAACLRFHDKPRADTRGFLHHLRGRHGFRKLMIVSGDREQEVRFLAQQIGDVQIELHAGQSPEQKAAIVSAETAQQKTLYLGDGINDAPALAAATVGLAMGQSSDITAEAAGAVILESSLRKVDELLHIGHRLRRIALQSAVGGMSLSIAGMMLASAGHLSPVQGAVGQEVIDLLAVLNALRVGLQPASLTDYDA